MTNPSRPRRSLTWRQLVTLCAVLPLGGAAAATALLGDVRWAVALLAALLTLATLGVLRVRRSVTAAQQSNRQLVTDLRQVVEQSQRRIVGALEAERVAAVDRQKYLLSVVQRNHRQAERGTMQLQRAQTREIEALLQLFRDVTPRAPMPSSGDFALNPTDLLELLHLVDERRPELVVELGSGTSTVWLAYALERFGGRLVSYDHDRGYAERTRSLLAAHGLEAVAEVREAPLRTVQLDGVDHQWYDPDTMRDLSDIDLLLVDGPPEATGPEARFPALPLLRDRLSATATVVLDDANRDGEQAALRRWVETVSGLTKDHEILGRHAVLSYRRPTTPAPRSALTTA